MGEEQDKFALAVIIFKLLNNGIHPFSGTPRKNTDDMLTIQARIEKYHYAYGLWPDAYQAPNPYSMHEYFDKKTLELFDRAFCKGQKRPTAKEWKEHLEYLFRNLKTCKKNPDHIYFTSKGCGLCAMEERFKQKIAVVREEKNTPPKIRGLSVSDLSTETNERLKKEHRQKVIRTNKFALGVLIFAMLFFALLTFILKPIKHIITAAGLSVQLLIMCLIVYGIFIITDYGKQKIPLLQLNGLTDMLKIYVIITLLTTFIVINDISFSFLL